MKKIFLFSVALLCNSTLTGAETRITLSPSLLHFDYTEFSTNDQVLDRETGWLPGIEVKLSHNMTAGWFINIHSAYYQGTVDYTGQTQSGAPHSTNTDNDLFRVGGQINKKIYQQIQLFAGVQLHRWNRDIKDNNNISGIDETYKWLEYSIGLSSDVFADQNNIFSVDIAYLLIRNGTLDVDLSRVNLGSTTLDLGDGSGARLNLNWKRIRSDNFNYGLSLFIEGWDFGRSNTKITEGGSPNVTVTEPRSETRNAGIKFNIEYLF